jgi:hypothetical protein
MEPTELEALAIANGWTTTLQVYGEADLGAHWRGYRDGLRAEVVDRADDGNLGPVLADLQT